MSLSLSRRTSRIEQAEIRSMSIECERMGGINLAQGVCNTPVPAVIVEQAFAGMQSGTNSYTRHDGLTELREAISDKVYRYNGIKSDPQTDVVVSAGSTGAFYCVCLALLDPGDEVIVFEPYYGYHINTINAVEAQARFVRLEPPDWSFVPAALEDLVTARSKAILINTPGNPSGKVFSRAELNMLAEFAERHDLFVFTDEIYEHFLYDGREHVSPASVAGLSERTITISGFSKTFSITGWRIGYSISSPRWAQRIGYMNDLVYVCAPAPLQYGVARGLRQLGPSFYKAITQEYLSKRERICCALEKAGLKPFVPHGAYYVLADVSSLPGQSSKDRAMYLLRQTGVAAVPGQAFFHDDAGDHVVRFCFAKTEDELGEACDRLSALHDCRVRSAVTV